MVRARRWITLALVIPALLSMSGFVRARGTFAITEGQDVQINLDNGVLKTYLQEHNSDAQSQDFCDVVETEGWRNLNVEPYDDGTFIGCKVSGLVPVGKVPDPEISLANGVWTFHMRPSEGTAADFTHFEMSVSFPGKVLSHSGSSTVSGTTVTWKDPADLLGPQGLVATGRAHGVITPSTALIGLLAALLVGAAVIAVVWQQQKRALAASASAPQTFPPPRQ